MTVLLSRPRILTTMPSRRAVLLLAVVAGACGGSTPTAPSPNNPAPSSLAPGRYSVAISATPDAGGLQPCLYMMSGSPLAIPTGSAAFMATAVSDGSGGLSVQPDAAYDMGWTMSVRLSGSAVKGEVRGVARDMISSQQTVRVNGADAQTPAELGGSFGSSLTSFGGPVTGHVVFENGPNSYSCGSNEWRMTRVDDPR